MEEFPALDYRDLYGLAEKLRLAHIQSQVCFQDKRDVESLLNIRKQTLSEAYDAENSARNDLLRFCVGNDIYNP